MIGLKFIGEIIKKNSEFYYSNTDGFRDYNVFKYWKKKGSLENAHQTTRLGGRIVNFTRNGKIKIIDEFKTTTSKKHSPKDKTLF